MNEEPVHGICQFLSILIVQCLFSVTVFEIFLLFCFEQVIMATNRHDTLDPALLRPGRLDRKIEFPMPDRRQKRLIFSTITAKMNLSEEVDLEDCILYFHWYKIFQQANFSLSKVEVGQMFNPLKGKFCFNFLFEMKLDAT